MPEHEPGDVVGAFADKVQIHVPPERTEQPHSFRTITPTEDGGATVTVEAGFTCFEFQRDVHQFEGVSYRVGSDHRDDDVVDDGEVKLPYPDGYHPDELHPLNGLSLSEFADMLASGELQPTDNPRIDHE